MTFNDGPSEGAILDNPMNILSTGRWQCQGCWWTSVGRLVVCPALLALADPCQWPFGLQSMLKGQQSPSVRDNTPIGHSVDCISAPEEKQKKKGNGGLESFVGVRFVQRFVLIFLLCFFTSTICHIVSDMFLIRNDCISDSAVEMVGKCCFIRTTFCLSTVLSLSVSLLINK